MAKKRKQRRNPIAQLDYGQEIELVFAHGKEPDGRGNKQCFADALQKRAAYFAHRDYLINESFINKNHNPGKRPGAWWVYEAKAKRPGFESKTEDWEVLIQLGEMDQAEIGAVLSRWLRELESNENILKWVYRDYQKGELPLHYRQPWPEQVKNYERQAQLFAEYLNGGKVAVDTWEALKGAIEK